MNPTYSQEQLQIDKEMSEMYGPPPHPVTLDELAKHFAPRIGKTLTRERVRQRIERYESLLGAGEIFELFPEYPQLVKALVRHHIYTVRGIIRLRENGYKVRPLRAKKVLAKKARKVTKRKHQLVSKSKESATQTKKLMIGKKLDQCIQERIGWYLQTHES